MDAHEALTTRRTIHDYTSAPVEDSVLLRALTAALAAPNHRLTEPWRFVRVGMATREVLADIAAALKEKKGPLSDEARQRARNKVLSPPELLVMVQILSSDPEVREEDYAALACAQQNLALSLWADGVGCKWSSGAVTQAEASYRALLIPRDAQRIVGFLWVGYPAQDLPKARRKLSVDDVLRTVP